MKETRGFSILELVMVLAIAGVLLSIGIVAIPQDRFAVNQAAEIVASQVTRTRFEAIKGNRRAWLELTASGAGGYSICLDDNADGDCDAGEEVQSMAFGVGDFGRVKVASVPSSPYRITFDRRGVPVGTPGGDIVLSNTSGDYTKTIAISNQGKADVQ